MIKPIYYLADYEFQVSEAFLYYYRHKIDRFLMIKVSSIREVGISYRANLFVQ